ncbi:MAG: DUF480 domain-containing protein [Sphingobacteriales bacterium]|nr:MAG: DUF480 domain-containing protein [Sphingobacteriales bacterium]TAF82562.1 MAG: DUF480 domain-containing protein [Sphingobacteriales bacterium]
MQIPILSSTETRILGALMEKCKTTPDYYPLTLNALAAACNQKTARKPLVQYDDNELINALDTLKRKGLISTATGGTSRSTKYKHNFAIVFPFVPAQLALICLLFLRGAQTPGELNAHSGRLYEFESLDEVNQVLNQLMEGENPYIVEVPRKAGQKEVRFTHLFNGLPDFTLPDFNNEPELKTSGLENRIALLEQQLSDLKNAFDALVTELKG